MAQNASRRTAAAAKRSGADLAHPQTTGSRLMGKSMSRTGRAIRALPRALGVSEERAYAAEKSMLRAIDAHPAVDSMEAIDQESAARRLQRGAGRGADAAGRGVETAGRGIDAAGRAAQTAGAAVEKAGQAVSGVGRGIEAAGKGAASAGSAMSKAGKAMSSTKLGAIIGVPLTALGGGAQALGKGAEGAGKATQAAGKATQTAGQTVNQAGRATRQAGDTVRGQGAQMRDVGRLVQLSADQGRGRREQASLTNPADEDTLLELPTRSYALPAETEEEREKKRQQGMNRTMQRFINPGGVPIEGVNEEEEGAPRRGPGQPEEGLEPLQPGQTPGPDAAALSQLAAQLDSDQRRQILRLGKAEVEQATQQTFAESKAVKYQKLLRILDGVEVMSSEAVVPLLLLILQLNAQVVNKWIFKTKFIPPTSFPEDVATCCADCTVCFLGLLNCMMYIIPFAILAVMLSGLLGVTVGAVSGLDGLF